MKSSKTGFTLIEVMIALGILAVSLVTLNARQSYSLRSVTEAEKLTLATMLARTKMAELEIELRNVPFSEIKKEENGEFEDYPEYSWIRLVEEIELNVPISQTGDDGMGVKLSDETFAQKLSEIISEHVRKVTLMINYNVYGNSRKIQVITHIVDLAKEISIAL